MNPKDLIKQALQKHKEREENVVYVTELISCPIKQQFYASNNQDYNFHLLVGSAIHEYIQKRVNGAWKSEVPVRWLFGSYEIHGRIDLLNEKEKILVELKTGRFNYEHLIQVAFYLNRYPDFNAKIIYLSKSSGRFDEKVNVVSVKRPLTNDEIRQILYNYLSKSPKPLIREQCSYCPFKNQCPASQTEFVFDKIKLEL